MPSTKIASAGLSGSGVLVWSVQTTNFTAVAGNGYYVNTTSAAITVTLPATPSAGNQIALVDYAGTFDTKNFQPRAFFICSSYIVQPTVQRVR